MEWIGVKERLPEVNGNYLCAMRDNIVEPFVAIHQFYNGKFIMQEWFVENVGRAVTHWMPLPEPPKERGVDNV